MSITRPMASDTPAPWRSAAAAPESGDRCGPAPPSPTCASLAERGGAASGFARTVCALCTWPGPPNLPDASSPSLDAERSRSARLISLPAASERAPARSAAVMVLDDCAEAAGLSPQPAPPPPPPEAVGDGLLTPCPASPQPLTPPSPEDWRCSPSSEDMLRSASDMILPAASLVASPELPPPALCKARSANPDCPPNTPAPAPIAMLELSGLVARPPPPPLAAALAPDCGREAASASSVRDLGAASRCAASASSSSLSERLRSARLKTFPMAAPPDETRGARAGRDVGATAEDMAGAGARPSRAVPGAECCSSPGAGARLRGAPDDAAPGAGLASAACARLRRVSASWASRRAISARRRARSSSGDVTEGPAGAWDCGAPALPGAAASEAAEGTSTPGRGTVGAPPGAPAAGMDRA
mmetsp:Transcript_4876/g.14147  ORF Transcript_4876/g.14147 Transcript_4876/m.14147 type:complete len:417 (+) Transcript_4876:168-1418(+)